MATKKQLAALKKARAAKAKKASTKNVSKRTNKLSGTSDVFTYKGEKFNKNEHSLKHIATQTGVDFMDVAHDLAKRGIDLKRDKSHYLGGNLGKKATSAKKSATKRTSKLSGMYPKGTKTTYEVTTGRAGGKAKMKYTNIDEMFRDLKTAFRLGYAEKATIEAIMVLPANA